MAAQQQVQARQGQHPVRPSPRTPFLAMVNQQERGELRLRSASKLWAHCEGCQAGEDRARDSDWGGTALQTELNSFHTSHQEQFHSNGKNNES